MKSLTISETTSTSINCETLQSSTTSKPIVERSSTSQSSSAGQRRLRTETSSSRNPHVLLAMAAPNAPVDQGFIDVLMKYGNLFNAVNADDSRAVELFVQHGANPNERSNVGRDRYVYADAVGWHELVIDGMTPLDAAVKHKNAAIVISLLKAGADPTLLRNIGFERSSDGKAPIRLNSLVSPINEVLKNRDYVLLRAFVQFKADFNKPCHGVYGYDYETPLGIALRMQDAEAVKILLEGGAKP